MTDVEPGYASAAWILLVEDNPDDAEMTLAALGSRIARQVTLAKDGQQALDILFRWADANGQPTQPRVVLLDLHLPKVDGIEVLRRMRADDRLATIPVVMLTSSDQENDIIEAYHLGLNSYVAKPGDPRRFHQAVEAIGVYWMSHNLTPLRP